MHRIEEAGLECVVEESGRFFPIWLARCLIEVTVLVRDLGFVGQVSGRGKGGGVVGDDGILC